MKTKTGRISQFYLKDVKDLQDEIVLAKSKISNLKKELDSLEQLESRVTSEILTAVNNGLKISKGRLSLEVYEEKKMPRLAWKELFIKAKSSRLAERLMRMRKPVFEKKIRIINNGR